MVSEQQKQSAKEQAVLLALQHDRALIRRGLEVYAMKKDGSTELVSKSKDHDFLWQDALNSLKKKYT